MEEDQDTIEEESEPSEQHPNSKDRTKDREWLAPYQFKPGQSGNPSGRPKGPSMKEWVKLRLAQMNDEERLDFLKGLNKGTIWKMAEGAPEAKTDITTNGESITITPEALALAKEYEEKLKKGL